MTKRYNDPRVLVGEWFDKASLREHTFKTSNNLAKYRVLSKSFDSPYELDAVKKEFIKFGEAVSLCSLNIRAPKADFDIRLGAKIDVKHMLYHTEPHEYCKIVGYKSLEITEKNVFIVMNPDCSSDTGYLKYSQDFVLALSSSTRKKPLYIRYDAPAHPGLRDINYVYLSHNPVANTRFKVLPIQNPNLTRLEQEGKPVPSYKDVVINQSLRNLNLSVNIHKWHLGFQGSDCEIETKTCLDVYRRELPNNVWQINN